MDAIGFLTADTHTTTTSNQTDSVRDAVRELLASDHIDLRRLGVLCEVYGCPPDYCATVWALLVSCCFFMCSVQLERDMPILAHPRQVEPSKEEHSHIIFCGHLAITPSTPSHWWPFQYGTCVRGNMVVHRQKHLLGKRSTSFFFLYS